MTAPAFREPITPSIATTTTVAAPAPTSRVQHDPRPLPVQIHHHHHHHHHHRVPHRLQHRHTSHIHTKPSPIRKPYRSTWAIPAPWSLKKQRGQRTRSKSQRDDKFSPSVTRSGSPERGPSRMRCSKTKIYTRTMRIPPPHAIEGYAPGIPTAGPSSGFSRYIRWVFDVGRGHLRVGMLQPQPQTQPQLRL